MKVYLHDEHSNGLLQRLCLEQDVSLLTPNMVDERSRVPEGYLFFLDQVDALVLEITRPTQDIHFILAQAVLSQKPTLCVYGKNQPPHELLLFLKKKGVPRMVKTFSYTEKNIQFALKNFIDTYDPARDRDNEPSIKFTLRLSPKIDRWITREGKRKKKSKADLLREWLELEMERSFDESIGETAPSVDKKKDGNVGDLGQE